MQTPPVVTLVSESRGLGRLRLEATRRGLVRLQIFSRRMPDSQSPAKAGDPRRGRAIAGRAAGEVREYLAGRRRAFTCPLDFRAMPGSPFQRKVWKALLAIPFGQTRTYGEVARTVGRPVAFRAVGTACRRNPVAVVIPCHRVIGSDGRLAGYSAGLAVKRRLLKLERYPIVK